MAESQSFSMGVDNLLQAIRPYGRVVSSFPPELPECDARRQGNESLRGWFVRLVDETCDKDPRRVALEDNLAVFVILRWEGRKRLSYASIQTLYSTCDLEEFYFGEDAEAFYLRLDFDYATLGEPFSHPLAHVHVDGPLSPRFALDGGDNGNIVIDYLEFLYRNYVPGKWLQWVRRVWSQEFAGSASRGEVAPLPTIVKAFTSSQFHVLRKFAPEMDRIKRVLRRRKDNLFDLGIDGADRVILEYPLAR